MAVPLTLKVKRIPEDNWGRPRLQIIDEDMRYNGKILADVLLGDYEESKGSNKIPGYWHTVTASYGEPIAPIKDEIVLELIED